VDLLASYNTVSDHNTLTVHFWHVTTGASSITNNLQRNSVRTLDVCVSEHSTCSAARPECYGLWRCLLEHWQHIVNNVGCINIQRFRTCCEDINRTIKCYLYMLKVDDYYKDRPVSLFVHVGLIL
jgi:hypothetical protein